ncbi:MAG: hypothetical protein ACTSV2_14440 [Candidatus Thorarchaeota archaeon]
MSLANARRIIREVRESENILYRPQFTGKSWESDALDRVRMKLLDCLVWIELSGRNYDKRLLEALRNLVTSIRARNTIRILQAPNNIISYQERYRDELANRVRDIRRLIRDIPP